MSLIKTNDATLNHNIRLGSHYLQAILILKCNIRKYVDCSPFLTIIYNLSCLCQQFFFYLGLFISHIFHETFLKCFQIKTKIHCGNKEH